MAAPQLVLHVGFQQTGARMLGRALTRLRPQLHRQGIGLIGHAALTRLAGAEGWLCDEAVDPGAVGAFERGVAGLVEEEAEAVTRGGGEARAIVVSSDHLLGSRNIDARDERVFRPLAVPSVAQMVRAVGHPPARLVLYVRRQDRLMEACYLRALQNGGTRPFGRQFPRRFEPVLDYHELIERLEALPEVADVRVRPFELVASSAPRYAHDFLSAVGVSGNLDLSPVGEDLRPYRLYSNRAAAIALDVNRHLGSQRERRLVRDFLIEHFPGTDDASTRLLTTDERRRVLEAYATVNRRLFERSMPSLPPDGYRTDEATTRMAAGGPTAGDPAAGAGPGRRRSPRLPWRTSPAALRRRAAPGRVGRG